MKPLPLSNLLSSEVASLMLPTANQTLLLRACLQPGESARQAWQQWQNPGNVHNKTCISGTEGLKIIAPLIFTAVRSRGFEIDKDSQTYLRSAYLREEMRSKIFRRICHNVLLAFEKAGLPAIVLKGTALAETVYGDPVLRHCHDVDILLPAEEMSRAAVLLQALEFRLAHQQINPNIGHVRMEHESGLPLELHSSLFQVPHYDAPLSEIRARCYIREIAGVTTRVLTPADNLLHVCGHASYSSSRHSLRWVSDAWFILDRHPNLDWELLLDCARRSHLAIPLSVMLGYLAEHLDAPIPATFLKRLDAVASQTDAAGWEAALWGTLPSTRGDLKRLIWATPNWRARVHVIKWLLIPSPHYLRWAEQMRHAWLLPLYYLYRPLRYIGRRAWFHCKNFIQRKALQGDPVTP